MERFFLALQAILATAGAWISAKLGILAPVLIILAVMMALDYVTGMLASKQEALDHPDDPEYGWSSKKGSRGIVKKVGYLCIIAVGMVVDYIIVYVAASIGLEISIKAFFGLLCTVWYILNELLSVIENAGRMGAPVPEWLKKYIAVLKNQVEHKTDSKDSGGTL